MLPDKCGICNNHTQLISLSDDATNQDFGFYADMDFGDLPSIYAATELVEDGPCHASGSLSNLDVEIDGSPSTAADADNFDDGISRDVRDSWIPNSTVNLTASVSGGTGDLAAWLDSSTRWQRDGR